jgi:hypothetical protein
MTETFESPARRCVTLSAIFREARCGALRYKMPFEDRSYERSNVRNYKLFGEREEMRRTCFFEAGFARKSESFYAKIVISFETAAT